MTPENKPGYNPPVTRCCFCSGTDLTPFAEATYWREYDLSFVECSNCGLIFTNPMPNLDTITRGNQAWSAYRGPRGTVAQYRGGKEFALYLRTIADSGVLLDVGCAEGFFLLGIEENSDWKAEGVEIGEASVMFAREKLGVNVYLGTLQAAKSSPKKFDFLRMNNVIEHVQDPVEFLRHGNELLRTGGRVYCSTPNGVQEGAFLRTANRNGIRLNLLENHFFLYPPGTLRNIFSHCGFEVQKGYSEDISHSLHDFGIMSRFQIPHTTQDLAMTGTSDAQLEQLGMMSDAEVSTLKTHPTMRVSRLKRRLFIRKVFQIRFPTAIPLGHQQHIFAEKRFSV